MSHDDDFIHGLIAPDDPGNSDTIEIMAYEILDDVLHNIVHDILIEVHREEKILRANSAVIAMEYHVAKYPAGDLVSPIKMQQFGLSSSTGLAWETHSAICVNGDINLLGNPLQTQKEIYCSKCRLRLRVEPPVAGAFDDPDADTQWCPHVPIMNEPGLDVHGRAFATSDGKGKGRKQSMKDGSLQASSQPQAKNAASSFDSSGPATPSEELGKKKPLKKESYPNTKCRVCGTSIAINVFARHLSNCLGKGRKARGRTAQLKPDAQANGSRGASAPVGSRKSTPLPPQQKKSPPRKPSKKSPQQQPLHQSSPKRAASSFGDENDDDDEYQDTAQAPKKKKSSPKQTNKKSPSKRAASNLEDDDEEDEYRDSLPKKKRKPISKKPMSAPPESGTAPQPAHNDPVSSKSEIDGSGSPSYTPEPGPQTAEPSGVKIKLKIKKEPKPEVDIKKEESDSTGVDGVDLAASVSQDSSTESPTTEHTVSTQTM